METQIQYLVIAPARLSKGLNWHDMDQQSHINKLVYSGEDFMAPE